MINIVYDFTACTEIIVEKLFKLFNSILRSLYNEYKNNKYTKNF